MPKRNVSGLAVLVFALVFATAGCGDARPASSATDSASAEGAVDDTLDAAVHDDADGPKTCRAVGEILCDADLEGYVRDATSGLATSATYGNLRLSDVISAGKQRYAMIFLSAYW